MGKSSKSSNKSDPGLSAFVVSYVPLLTGRAGAGVSIDSMEVRDVVNDVLAEVEKLPDGRVAACIWLSKDNSPYPVLAIENMNQIVDHIEWWAEGKPLDWFELKLLNRDGKYAVVLVPRFEKSVERWNLAYQLRVGYPPPRNTDYKIIFRAIHFVSGTNTTYDAVKDLIGNELKIGFIDLKNVNREDPSQIDDSDIRILGSFPVSQNANLDEYIGSILDDAKKNPSLDNSRN